MRTKILAAIAATAALGSLAFAPAAGQVCYDVDVVVNGDEVVNEEGCEELPEAPTP